MRFRLIPVGHGSHIVLPLEQAAVADADLLDGDPQILLKQDRIRDVPPVEAALGQLVVGMVIVMQEGIPRGIVGIAEEGRAEGVFHRPSLLLRREAPGAAEIVFGPRSADRGIIRIPVQIKLYLALSVPVPLQGGQRQVGAHVLSLSLHAVQDHIVLSLFREPLPAPLRMEISGILRQLLRQAVIHLIEKGMHILVALIFQRDPRLLPEGHGKIQVEPSGGIDGHRQGQNRSPSGLSTEGVSSPSQYIRSTRSRST